MKKVAGILVTASLLFSLSADAAVSTKVNKDDTTTYISQTYLSGPWDSIKVQYTKEKSLPTITLSIADPSYNNPTYYLFSDKTTLVIDGVVSDLKLVDTYRDRNNDLGIFEFTPAQIASIQSAKKVSLRVSFYNKNTLTWKVSEKMVNDWKEVFAGERKFTKDQNRISLQNSMPQNMHSTHHGN
ncbi:hypothetical protein [Sporomusa acidovorans]|uniref:hypothetical protein n=1 Tax=Sporomusa acidovorans TaxID=112900 RepID=UPI00088C3FB5|nr:hypothetical protein [Sporomusa acidovorans]OZC19115.1 hypothetical protein SPACI_32010 [Sporomusa acidovorans DSM 3132]SDD67739.1 hypothetical protein SAMN04488499_100361 [Sporomusa acidovorans]